MTDLSKLSIKSDNNKSGSDNNKNRIDLAVELQQELLSLPSITKVHLSPGSNEGTNLEITTSHRSLSQLNKSNAIQTISLSSNNLITSTSNFTFISSELLHTCHSSDGKRSALFKSLIGNDKEKGGGGKNVKLIEIWNVIDGQKEGELDVSKSHGDWYFDGRFIILTRLLFTKFRNRY